MDENHEFSNVYSILRVWEEEHQSPNYDPVPVLNKLSELIESETEIYMKMNPDPFENIYPHCSLAQTIKFVLTNIPFLTKLFNDCMCNCGAAEINIAAIRLILNFTPMLKIDAFNEMTEGIVLHHLLFSWAEKSVEPLQTYATGILAAAMETQENTARFREQNVNLYPLMLERLHNLHAESLEENGITNSRPFAHLGNSDSDEDANSFDHKTTPKFSSVKKEMNEDISEISTSKDHRLSTEGMMFPPLDKPTLFSMSDCSNLPWAEMETFVIGNVQIHPLTKVTQKIFILKYLTQMSVYQEFLSHVFEKNTAELIMQLINLRETKNSRLAFEALRYLAILLCHKTFAIEFININGLQKLLKIPRPSIAATGVSVCLCYLAHCDDAMECVSLLPKHVLTDLVKYTLWLLKCSHDSGRVHAVLFFGLSFQFRVILEEFDAQDGLRKLFNVISTLPILTAGYALGTEDANHTLFRHVCYTLKTYFEAHLYFKSEQIRRTQMSDSVESSKVCNTLPSNKALKSSPEEVREQISTLLDHMFFRAVWSPANNFLHFGGITLLLRGITFAFLWNCSKRDDTVRCALDVLNVCSVMPRIQLKLCEKVNLAGDTYTVGMNVILSAAEGEIVADSHVQRAALHVLITCACAPLSGSEARYSAGGSSKKKIQYFKNSEEVIKKMWECLRTTNGLMILLDIIKLKTPTAEADTDSFSALACQVLAGFARIETAHQMISKLYIFTTGQVQSLMKNPILQDGHQGQAMFRRYAFELLERIKNSKPKNEPEPPLTNIHKANASCNNPMATCQQFTLFEPHKCPDPKLKNKVPQNFVMRYARGTHSKRLDQKLIHSKFCGVTIFKFRNDSASYYTCSDFFGDDRYIAIGTNKGKVRLFNAHNGVEVSNRYCHTDFISRIQASRKHSLLLTSSSLAPLSACWEIKDNIFNPVLLMEDDYAEFNKLTEDRIIGTKAQTATIYDIETKKPIQVLKTIYSNRYLMNKATFCPTNELVLSDGVLWDVNSGKEIHKFDKLNQITSGVFHPNGLEIVANTEVWDLRTFHLLRTVPALDKCVLNFAPNGYIIYSFPFIKNEDPYEGNHSLRTYDAYDYSSIVSIDVKKNIYDLACNRKDTQIALIENQGVFGGRRGSYVQIYNVGQSRTVDEEDEDDEDEDDEDVEDMDISDEGSNSDEVSNSDEGSNSDEESNSDD